ncbi:unnamed protein product [Timema podura]|uniref:BESS domain-containing protein n=1 Tax=Timema podura TaxID=61482 RepID=A0ABN7NLE4_TIMPD|nr:unnamed protein product [Timema podura]
MGVKGAVSRHFGYFYHPGVVCPSKSPTSTLSSRTTSASSVEDAEEQSAEDKVESQTDLGPNQLTERSKPTQNNQKSLVRNNTSELEFQLSQFMTLHKEHQKDDPDKDDRAFFESLLPSLRSLDTDEKLNFRIVATLQVHNTGENSGDNIANTTTYSQGPNVNGHLAGQDKILTHGHAPLDAGTVHSKTDCEWGMHAGNERSDLFDICCHAWNDDKADKPKLIECE